MERATDLIIYLALFIVSLIVLTFVALFLLSAIAGLISIAIDKVREGAEHRGRKKRKH